MGEEETTKPLSARLSDYLCQCGVVVIGITIIGIYLFLDWFGPFPLPSPLQEFVTIFGAATALILLLIVLPVGIILGIIYDRRKKAQKYSSIPVEPSPRDQESQKEELTHCPICGALLQGGEQFCPECGVAITDSAK